MSRMCIACASNFLCSCAYVGQDEQPSPVKEGLPLFLFCHANGFCKEVWKPVVEELSKVGLLVSADKTANSFSIRPDRCWAVGASTLQVDST